MRTHTPCFSLYSRMVHPLLCGSFLILFCVRLWAQLEDWASCHTVEHAAGNLFFSAPWQPERGLRLRVAANGRQVTLDLNVGGLNLDGVTARERDLARFQADALPSESVGEVEWTLKFRDQGWYVYGDDRLVLDLPAPFSPPALVSISTITPAIPGSAYFQKANDFLFSDRFLVPEGQTNQLTGWEMVSGTWILHTVRDELLERGDLDPAKQVKVVAAYSPNFYSLSGKGRDAVIVAGHYFYDRYELEASVECVSGRQGIVFYYVDPERYHAFTIERTSADDHDVWLSLWKRDLVHGDAPRVLKTVHTRLGRRQWVMLKVRTWNDRVQCFMDHVKVMDAPMDLPAGGQFGLYVDSRDGAVFDDVSAATHHDLELDRAALLRRHVLREDGAWLRTVAGQDADPVMRLPVASTPRRLVVGAHAGRLFAADVAPHKDAFEVGLLADYCGPHQPWYRFTLQRTNGCDTCGLDRVQPDGKTVRLERLVLPAAPRASLSQTQRLACDAVDADEMRFYCNDQLVLVHRPDEPVRGASGLYLGPNSAAAFSNLTCRTRHDSVFEDLFEKNRAYVEDPFMRHWSSPEGQWIAMTNRLTWYKGDIFGGCEIRLPYVTNSSVHLYVPEGATNGAITLRADKECVALYVGAGSAPAFSVPVAQLNAIGPEATGKWYTLHGEGHWIWLTSSAGILGKLSLIEPPCGTRLRIAGFNTEQLTHSCVKRRNVKDYLFTSSLHEWNVAGGAWSVVNRFQCAPQWSHLNGESAEGRAALWSKYKFSGDFCLEMYAGMRHEWYERAGDLNVTVMSADRSPQSGYTVVCTGWDPDHSQHWTRLYRNGEKIRETDKYLVPRRRSGYKRKGYNPLLEKGRDMHGAWYYIKFRRIGDRLEYWFDNELAFSAADSDALPDGSLGIWTFMNSMMVARVKMAAERIMPRSFAFREVDPQEPARVAARRAKEKPLAPFRSGLSWRNAPLEWMHPDTWQPEPDNEGETQWHWHDHAGTNPWFSVRNTYAGGRMKVLARKKAVPYKDLAGWRFEVARTPDARFNGCYSLGYMDGKKGYMPQWWCLHHLSGSAFSNGTFYVTGAADMPARIASGFDNSVEVDCWTPVTVWLPCHQIENQLRVDKLYVRFEGFGNFQPSAIIQGLEGNGAGEAYAVRGMETVFRGAPLLSLDREVLAHIDLAATSSGAHGAITFSNALPLQVSLDARAEPGLNQARLRCLRHDGCTVMVNTVWLQVPPVLRVDCAWSPDVPVAFELKSLSSFPDPRFWRTRVTLNGRRLLPEALGPDKRLCRLPRDSAYVRSENGLTVMAAHEQWRAKFELDWSAAPLNEPPVMIELKGPVSSGYQNFEEVGLKDLNRGGSAGLALVRDRAAHNVSLRISNNGQARRLRKYFTARADLAQYPLLQFAYRGGFMAHVSMKLGRQMAVHLSETYANAQSVRWGAPLKLDNQWHDWVGLVSGAWSESPLTNLYKIRSLLIGSADRYDQTGRCSVLFLDDLVFGPAINRAEQLSFTPCYFDFDGIDRVEYVCHQGNKVANSLNPKQLAAMHWIAATNEVANIPVIAGLSDGICHLYIRACDRLGAWSDVTDIPFLLDRKPVQATCSFAKIPDPMHNGSMLRIDVQTDQGAPFDLDALEFAWNGNKVPMTSHHVGSRMERTSKRDRLFVNWPYIVRWHLDKAEEGITNILSIANIRDGAGNTARPIEIPYAIDYSKDRTPPTLVGMRLPTNVLFHASWETYASKNTFFHGRPRNSVTAMRLPDQAPFLEAPAQAGKDVLELRLTKPWHPARHPYVAFRMRRSDMRPKDKTRFFLGLNCDGNVRFAIPLSPNATIANLGLDNIQLCEGQLVPWRSNVWHDVTMNIYEVLKQAMHKDFKEEQLYDWDMPETLEDEPDVIDAEIDKILHRHAIKSVYICRLDARANELLHLQSFFIFSAWMPDSKIRLLAFDASGVAGAMLGCDNIPVPMQFATRPIDPLRGDQTTWMIVRARDRAGNLTDPLRIPMMGTVLPVVETEELEPELFRRNKWKSKQ